MAADSFGVTPIDNAEFLLGNVLVTPVLFESDGTIDPNSQDWDIEGGEIDQVIDKITEGVNWWSTALDQLDTVHELNFTVDDSFAQNPHEIPYEPIDGSSEVFHLWVGNFLHANGYGVGKPMSVYENLEAAIREFNDDQRIKHGADWSFTVFVVDSSDDPLGFFKSGSLRGAYAFAGGLFFVMPSTRPASTVAHEMGHIFWARDEYSRNIPWDIRRGYYDAQNLNSLSNDNPGFTQDISIMRGGTALLEAYETFYSAEATLAHVGWRDSDGDGIFDLADVPLDLQGSGYFDPITSTYRFVGSASAVPLMNQNSSGPQSDITFNRISRLQYRIYENPQQKGPWMTVAEPNQQVVAFDESFEISEPFSGIEFRVIDDSVGVVSPIIEGSNVLPAFSDAAVTGVSFIDQNANGERDAGEVALANTTVNIMHGDGASLFEGEFNAALFSDGQVTGANGAAFRAIGPATNGDVGVQDLNAATRSLQWWDPISQAWNGGWSDDVHFEAVLDQPVGQVTIHGVAIDQPGFLRIEAYDVDGQLLGRVTSPAIELGTSVPVTIQDRSGRIASVRAYGHARSEVGLERVEFGHTGELVADEGGAFRVRNLPDGQYQVELTAENVIHQFESKLVDVQVLDGVSSIISAAAERVDSTRYNSDLPFDTNGDGLVSSRDALVVINDIARFGSRLLSETESGFDVDSTNDGMVTAVDALVVINQLSRQIDGASGEQVTGLVISYPSTEFRSLNPVPILAYQPIQRGGSGEQIASFTYDAGVLLSSGSSLSESSDSPESNPNDLSEPFLQPPV